MRRSIITALAAALLSTTAFAADMPTKAAKYNPFVFPSDSGWYWDMAVKGGAEQDSASGSILGTSLVSGNVNALGAGVGGSIGYMKALGAGPGGVNAVAFESSLYYQNVTGSASATSAPGGVGVSVPASFASRWSADQVVKVFGFNPFSYLGTLGLNISMPTFTPPTVSGISLAAAGRGYWMAGIEEWGISGQFFNTNSGVTVGVAALVGGGLMTPIIDTTGKPTGAVLDTGCDAVFADKGLQVSGLFAPGQPVVGSLTSGRKYECFTKIAF
jgi:hypothetical protein